MGIPIQHRRKTLEYGRYVFRQRGEDCVVISGLARAPFGHPIVKFCKSRRTTRDSVRLSLQRDEGREIVRVVSESESQERAVFRSRKNHEAGREIIFGPQVTLLLRLAANVEEYSV